MKNKRFLPFAPVLASPLKIHVRIKAKPANMIKNIRHQLCLKGPFLSTKPSIVTFPSLGDFSRAIKSTISKGSRRSRHTSHIR